MHEIVRGNDERLIITLNDDAGQPYNLSGKTVTCEMRDEPEGTLLSTATVTITDAANGVLEALFSSTDTANLTEGATVYVDVKIVDNATGEITNAPIPPFRFTVVGKVTQ